MKTWILNILLFCSSTFITAQFTCNVDSNNYLIGEQAIIYLKYKGTGDFAWPTLMDTLTKELEIVNASKIDTIISGENLLLSQKLHITSWDTGYFIVPPIVSGELQTAPFLLRFNTVRINPTERIKPIKDQFETPFIFDEIQSIVLWLIFWLIIAAVLIALAYFFYNKYKRKPAPEPIIPARPVMEVLWERFEALQSSKLWEKDEEKEFHVELSGILRKFLEFKHRIKALEETTREITQQLNALGLDRKFKDEVIHILNFSDMVKFAKQRGVYAQHESALELLNEILSEQEEGIKQQDTETA